MQGMLPDTLENLYRVTADNDVERVTEMLVRAFMEDPLIVYQFEEEAGRKERSYHYFKFITRFCVLYGEVYADSADIRGAALWTFSETGDFTHDRMKKVGLQDTFQHYTPEIMDKMRTFYSAVGKAHDTILPQPHWQLVFLGVEPEYQGRGIAGKLLRPMMERIDGEKHPCYLETMKESNIPLYEHFGFRLVATLNPANSGVVTYIMVREARGNQGAG